MPLQERLATPASVVTPPKLNRAKFPSEKRAPTLQGLLLVRLVTVLITFANRSPEIYSTFRTDTSIHVPQFISFT